MTVPALAVFESRLQRRASVCLIGAGASGERELLVHNGHVVHEVDYARNGARWNLTASGLDDGQFDALYCSHTLEHMRNPGIALEHIYRVVRKGGIVGVVVPPLKHEIVGGHVTLWNAGLLCYQMILAGFDLSQASVATYDYNVAVITEKRTAVYGTLKHDDGDIFTLAPLFPLPFREGQDGRIKAVRWPNAHQSQR